MRLWSRYFPKGMAIWGGDEVMRTLSSQVLAGI
jgi:hypothetical protein